MTKAARSPECEVRLFAEDGPQLGFAFGLPS